MSRLAPALAALALAAFAHPAPAAAAKESAANAVKGATDKLKTALDEYAKAKGDERKAARDKVRSAVDSLLDFGALTKAAAGKHWDEMDAGQRKRFTDALRGVMEANYLVKGREAGQVDVNKVQTQVLGEEKGEKGTTLVKTKLTSGEDTAAVDYVLEHHANRWRAIDVLTEGASLVESYREQIQKLWPTKKFDGVVASLEKKRAKLETKLEQETVAKD